MCWNTQRRVGWADGAWMVDRIRSLDQLELFPAAVDIVMLLEWKAHDEDCMEGA